MTSDLLKRIQQKSTIKAKNNHSNESLELKYVVETPLSYTQEKVEPFDFAKFIKQKRNKEYSAQQSPQMSREINK